MDKFIEWQQLVLKRSFTPRVLTTLLLVGLVIGKQCYDNPELLSAVRGEYFLLLLRLSAMVTKDDNRKYLTLFTFLYITIGMSIFPKLKQYFQMTVVAYRKYFHFACFIFCVPTYIYTVLSALNCYRPISSYSRSIWSSHS